MCAYIIYVCMYVYMYVSGNIMTPIILLRRSVFPFGKLSVWTQVKHRVDAVMIYGIYPIKTYESKIYYSYYIEYERVF